MRRTSILVVLIAVLAAGCRDNDSATRTTSTTRRDVTTSSSSVLASLSAEQAAVFTAYTDCWRAYIDFGTDTTRVFTREDFDTKVGRCLTGMIYNRLLGAFSQQRPRGVFFRGPPIQHDSSPEVVVTGTSATVRDCMFDEGEVYDADDPGVVLQPADGKRELNVAELVKIDGTWKVADAKEEGECVV